MGAYVTTTIGPLEARYVAFLTNIAQIRPDLHRYCARMTGSVLDGEDVVQEALFEAYRKLDQYDESRPLSPWLFRIAHNRCIDFLRHRGVRKTAEVNVTTSGPVSHSEPVYLGVGRALEHLVLILPPKERACVLLKDVFDYSLAEIAELVASSVGGVKAALNRGRRKLATAPSASKESRTPSQDLKRVLELYIERFNRRDWDAVRELIKADAQLRVVDAFVGPLEDSTYFGNYARVPIPWKMELRALDGEFVAAVHFRRVEAWTLHTLVRFKKNDHKIGEIVDYSHCPWVASLAEFDLKGNVS
jgi:RNA polymerase sigma-70 factor (ECF subfamily)